MAVEEEQAGGAAKVSVWLGIAVSIIAVLAFFGVDDFKELQRWFDPQAEACERADAAARAKTGISPRVFLTYAGELRAAADTTDDPHLQGLLRADADAAEDYADTEQIEDYSRRMAAERRWYEYCVRHGT